MKVISPINRPGLGMRLAFSLNIPTGGNQVLEAGPGTVNECMYITTYLFCSPAHRRALSLS